MKSNFRLDLDAWINDPPEETDTESECEDVEMALGLFDNRETTRNLYRQPYQPEPTEEEIYKVNTEGIATVLYYGVFFVF